MFCSLIYCVYNSIYFFEENQLDFRENHLKENQLFSLNQGPRNRTKHILLLF